MLGLQMIYKFSKIVILSASALTLSSCVALAVGGAGLAGYTLVQERSVGAAIDDVAIEAEVNALLLREENKHLFSHVDVDSVEGRVLLTGTVPSRQAKIDVYKLAWQPDPVKEVINELNVSSENEFSAKKYASDAWISTQIESKLLFAKDIASVNYSVETIDGVVYLMGVARDKEELQKVAETASTISGVKRVVSHTRIKGKKYPKISRPNDYQRKVDAGSNVGNEIEETEMENLEVENTYNTEPKYLGPESRIDDNGY